MIHGFFVPSLVKQLADLLLGPVDIDAREVRRLEGTEIQTDFLGKALRHKRLAASGRAIEQHPIGDLQTVLLVLLPVDGDTMQLIWSGSSNHTQSRMLPSRVRTWCTANRANSFSNRILRDTVLSSAEVLLHSGAQCPGGLTYGVVASAASAADAANTSAPPSPPVRCKVYPRL